jgi:hypothetical protein
LGGVGVREQAGADGGPEVVAGVARGCEPDGDVCVGNGCACGEGIHGRGGAGLRL